jgi:hypothetical protein
VKDRVDKKCHICGYISSFNDLRNNHYPYEHPGCVDNILDLDDVISQNPIQTIKRKKPLSKEANVNKVTLDLSQGQAAKRVSTKNRFKIVIDT